jgi:hypothetical protein
MELLKRSRGRRADSPANLWQGWYVDGDDLVDGGGNRYGMHEIRAIFYTRKLLWYYRERERAASPPAEPLWLQFSLPGVGSYFDHVHKYQNRKLTTKEKCEC